MTRRCQISGKARAVGNKVSHANNKTRRRFMPNIRDARVFSDTLKRYIRVKITPAGLRTVEHNGGIDAWLLSVAPSTLDARLRKVRDQVEAAQAASK